MKPLTVGNVVSAGLRIYRDRFLEYYKLAFIGYLWVFVPLYGWAKYSAMMGLISRLAFGEVTEQPESIRDAQRFVKPRMWKFLIAGILVGLIFFVAMFFLGIIFSMAVGIFVNLVGQDFSVGSILLAILLALVGVLLVLFVLTWLFSRLLIVEVPLAIEENIDTTDAISRSWSLAKGSIFRLQLIILVGFLISLPIIIVIQIISTIIQVILGYVFSANPELFSPILLLLTLVISIAGGALTIPFWQCIKAVIYYDLRVRREGLGLNLEKS